MESEQLFFGYAINKKTPLEVLKRVWCLYHMRIGEHGAAAGFLTKEKVEALYQNISFHITKIY